jgi:hypothetical protein
MPTTVRPASMSDLPDMVNLLLANARSRNALNPTLWAIASDARRKVEDALRFALEAERQPFRQQWLVAESGARLVGLAHSMLLPVPPIYAGKWGDPGLLLGDCTVAEGAPADTAETLIEAAESDLRDAGAKLLLAAAVPGDAWQSHYAGQDYEPLTLYLGKAGLQETARPDGIRPAVEGDTAGIVARSAAHRRVIAGLSDFWTPHPDADARFGNWMRRSLTLQDRDMLVAGPPGAVNGYAIAQPASPLHFPTAHDISAVGIIDDYFHADFAAPSRLADGGAAALALLRAAESAFARRATCATLVICPAAWGSKRALLESAGYRTALIWMRKA